MDLFESIAVIPNPTDNFNEVYATINRTNGRTIERMARRFYPSDVNGEQEIELKNQIFVDGAVSYVNENTYILTSLDHLEGETVSVLADGQVLDQEVVASGQITIDSTYGTIHVGLPIISDLQTLPLEVLQ